MWVLPFFICLVSRGNGSAGLSQYLDEPALQNITNIGTVSGAQRLLASLAVGADNPAFGATGEI